MVNREKLEELNRRDLNSIYINNITNDNKYKKIFSNIEIKNNFSKKIYIRKFNLLNKKGISLIIKKLTQRKKIKGTCVDKIFDSDLNVIYYLYLLNKGDFCIIKVPNGIINRKSIEVLRTDNLSSSSVFVDKYNNEITLEWNKERIVKRLENSIKDIPLRTFNIKLFFKKTLKYLIKNI